MSSVRTAIVDDEAPARSRLRRALEADERFELIGEAANGPDAVELLTEYRPELVLLDIQMPGMSGFDVLRLLGDDETPAVIFVTAYDEYAVRAFKVAAVDYLLKPVSRKRLETALQRYLDRRRQSRPRTARKVLERLQSRRFLLRLPLRSGRRVRVLRVQDISHFTSEDRLIIAFDHQGQRYWIRETLDQLQRRLDPDLFFRIHRSSLINLDGRYEIEIWDDGRLRLHYPHTQPLVAARGPAKELRARVGL